MSKDGRSVPSADPCEDRSREAARLCDAGHRHGLLVGQLGGRRAVHVEVPPWGLTFWRWGIAFIILLPICWRSFRRDWPILRAAAYFLRYRVSSAPVTDDDGNLLGIVSELDVLAIAHSPSAPDRSVDAVMRSNVITYDESAPLSQVLSFMTRASMRRWPAWPAT